MLLNPKEAGVLKLVLKHSKEAFSKKNIAKMGTGANTVFI